MKINKKIGLRIKNVRAESKLSQKDFAAEIGITEYTLANYEKEKTPIPYNILVDIAARFKCDFYWLVTGSEEKVSDFMVKENFEDYKPDELVNHINKLVDENIKLKATCFDLLEENNKLKEEMKSGSK